MGNDELNERRKKREARLRELGYEELAAERRKELLAINVALLEWPRTE